MRGKVAFWALVKRDITLAWAQGGAGGLSLAFFMIATSLFPFAVGPDSEFLMRLAPGVIWVVALLAGLISLDRLFQADFEDGSLDMLALSPLSLEMTAFAKTLAHWFSVMLPLVILSPLLGLMLAMPVASLGWLLLSLLIGSPALSLIGSIGAALTVAVRRGGVLIALIILPLYIPVLIFGAGSLLAISAGTDPLPHLALSGAVSLFALFISPFASAAALRLGLE